MRTAVTQASKIAPTPFPLLAILALLLLPASGFAATERLKLHLIDHATQKPIAGVTVSAHEIQANGTLVQRATRTTDQDGMARFDLDGLGSGRVYVLKARPFSHWLTSKKIREPGWFGWGVGKVSITLIDLERGVALPGRKLVALKKAPTGKLTAYGSLTTDAHGKARFDLPGLGHGATYVLRADDPFEDGRRYFGPLLRSIGPVTFGITKGDTNRPDLQPPELQVSKPAAFAAVGLQGFEVGGLVTDNDRVRRVDVKVSGKGVLAEAQASIDRRTGRWNVFLNLPSDDVTGPVIVQAIATDRSSNVAEKMIPLRVIADKTPPEIRITSHERRDLVSDGAFVLSGYVTDNTAAPWLVALLIESKSKKTVDSRLIDISPSTGRWHYTTFANEVGGNEDLLIRLIAWDPAGNWRKSDFILIPSERDRLERHLIDRITFGATPELLDEVRRQGAQAFINRQLDPDSINEAPFRHAGSKPKDKIKEIALGQAIGARRQLLAMMSLFWDNHFNTLANFEFELREHNAFRRHALGRFRDLLGISARSPAMLRYLDGRYNVAGRPNENYARELLELHTLGIDGGYTQADVEEVARAFTGWTEREGAFWFNEAGHDTDPKTVLGHKLPRGRGIADGRQVLDILAEHPATARHICRKLASLLVGDAPSTSLVGRCADRFVATTDAPNQIAQVLRLILESEAFWSPRNQRSKVKTPLELGIGALRNLGGSPNPLNVPAVGYWIGGLGMPLFRNPVPSGYPEVSGAWVTTGSLMTRLQYLDRFIMGRGQFGGTIPSLYDRLTREGLETADGMVGRLLELTHGPTFTRADWQLGMSVLTEHGATPFRIENLDPEVAERRLRRTALAIMSLPGYQLQ